MNKTILTVLLLSTLALGACTKAKESTEVLENLGYSNIEIKGYGWTGCHDDDWYSTKFTAISPTNKKVKGVVCRGFFKNNTVRWG